MTVKERIAKVDKELEKMEWARFKLKYPNVLALIMKLKKEEKDEI